MTLTLTNTTKIREQRSTMPSPFPGMNPYLEQKDIWQDFHGTFIPAIRAALAHQVSPDYFVKVEEYLFIHEPSAEERLRLGRADVALKRLLDPNRGQQPGTTTAVLEAPRQLVVSTDFDIEKHEFLEIYDRKNREIVTVIEVLSPTNKIPGADREVYVAKRRGIFRSRAHFVEIDLLRGWPKMPTDEVVQCDYGVLISVCEQRPRAGYWPIMLRDRLPVIPIPLREPHPEVRLDLQEVLHKVYDEANYKSHIYLGTPEPPLNAEDAAWAEALANSEKANP